MKPTISQASRRLHASALIMLFAICVIALQAQNAPPTSPTEDYSGMYSFLQEGEFLQLTVEEQGNLTGFVSRYSDAQADHQKFVDHFFKQGKINGRQVSFITDTVQNISYDFKGSVERGEGKNPGDEAYYTLTGTLTENVTGANGKITSKSQPVTLKSFPQDVEGPK